jgi:hypothetical protein
LLTAGCSAVSGDLRWDDFLVSLEMKAGPERIAQWKFGVRKKTPSLCLCCAREARAGIEKSFTFHDVLFGIIGIIAQGYANPVGGSERLGSERLICLRTHC